MNKMISLFTILGVGYILASVLFCVERFLPKEKSNYTKEDLDRIDLTREMIHKVKLTFRNPRDREVLHVLSSLETALEKY